MLRGTERAMIDCACGGNTDHMGTCHFGWHNPKTCPKNINFARMFMDGRTIRRRPVSAYEKAEVETMIRDTIINDIRVFTGADTRAAEFTADSIIKYLESIGYRAKE